MPNKTDLLNYKEKLIELEKEKVELKKLDKDSNIFKTSLKKYFEELIFLKCHAFCMDGKEERGKLLKILWQEMESFKLI